MAALIVVSARVDAGEGPPRSHEPTVLALEEGRSGTVPGTDIAIEVTAVRDLTSRGCLGGPWGCPDQARLVVSAGGETRKLVLFAGHAALPRRPSRATVFGRRIELTSLRGKAITLSVEEDPGAGAAEGGR